MKIDQGLMDAYTSGSTNGGETNWEDRDDRAGIQAVLDTLAPEPSDGEEIDEDERCVVEALIRGSRVGRGWARTPAFRRTLETVVAMLAPWSVEP